MAGRSEPSYFGEFSLQQIFIFAKARIAIWSYRPSEELVGLRGSGRLALADLFTTGENGGSDLAVVKTKLGERNKISVHHTRPGL